MDRRERLRVLTDVGRALANSAKDIMKIIEEEEQQEAESSTRRTRKQIVRNRMAASDRLMSHYFNDDAVYGPAIFRRRFRMHKPLFLRIVNDVVNVSSFIRQGYDARGAEGFTPIQKCAAAIRQLAYGSVSDSWDEYFQMSERVVRESLDEFCEYVIFLYKKRYLRKPTSTDVQQLYAHHAQVHEIESHPLYEPGSDSYLAIRSTIRDSVVHHYLRNDLAEHLWFATSVDLNTIPEDDEEDISN